MRAGTFFGAHLEFGPPEFLDLEPVAVLAGVASPDSEEAQANIAGAQVDSRRQAEREVEATQLAGFHLALGQLVPPWPLYLVGDSPQFLRQGLEISSRREGELPHPALDPHLFSGFVHAPVIKDVPDESVPGWCLDPAGPARPP